MVIHLIQGKEGCAFAKAHRLGIVVVDALRASATATMLFHYGANSVLVTDEVEQAYQLKKMYPDALLFGERNGLPPAGFNFGNSPKDAVHAKDKKIIFTTTTGARLLFEGWDDAIPFLIMGTTINAKALCRFLLIQNKDCVIVPAGLYDDASFSAQEDWVAGIYIASLLPVKIEYGKHEYEYWKKRIDTEGIEKLFSTAPHAEKLRKVGLEQDILWCAQTNISNSIPRVIQKEKHYLVLGSVSV